MASPNTEHKLKVCKYKKRDISGSSQEEVHNLNVLLKIVWSDGFSRVLPVVVLEGRV